MEHESNILPHRNTYTPEINRSPGTAYPRMASDAIAITLGTRPKMPWRFHQIAATYANLWLLLRASPRRTEIDQSSLFFQRNTQLQPELHRKLYEFLQVHFVGGLRVYPEDSSKRRQIWGRRRWLTRMDETTAAPALYSVFF